MDESQSGALPGVGVDPGDRAEATELLARYAEAIDSGDFGAIGALLSKCVITDAEGHVIATGADEITALYRSTTKRHEGGTPLTTHIITNVIVDRIAEGELEMRSRYVVFQCTQTLPLQPIAVGRYVDRVVRDEAEDGAWRFARRAMIPEFWGTTTEHLTFVP